MVVRDAMERDWGGADGGAPAIRSLVSGPPHVALSTLSVVPGGRGEGEAASGQIADPSPLALLGGAGLHDVASPRGVHAGLVLGVALDVVGPSPLVWITDALARLDFGTPHPRGLARGPERSGLDPARLTLVRAARPVDALWAMEEALRARIPVVGEILGDPRVLDFTATRRLEMRARRAGVPCVLVRVGSCTAEGSSGARYRWRVEPHPSRPDPFDPKAPGAPQWRLELTRARDRPPGCWVVEPAQQGEGRDDDGEGAAPHRLRVAATLADGGVAEGAGAAGGERASALLAFPAARRGRPGQVA